MTTVTQSSPIWSCRNRTWSGMTAAAAFARETFDDDRLVAAMEGRWIDRDWDGWFTLIGGVRTYRLHYDGITTEWTVSIQE